MKAIVNVNESWGIGRDGELLVNIPEDMKFFRTTTAGSVVIMGRKTLESFPGAKPLKGRVNVVLTRDASRIPKESIAAADSFIAELDSKASIDSFMSLCERVISLREEPAAARPTVLAVCDSAEHIDRLCRELDEHMFEAGMSGAKDSIYVIGGASIYEQLLEYCDTCIVTINDSRREADSFFPRLSELKEWEHSVTGETKEYEGIHYHFDTFTRKA